MPVGHCDIIKNMAGGSLVFDSFSRIRTYFDAFALTFTRLDILQYSSLPLVSAHAAVHLLCSIIDVKYVV